MKTFGTILLVSAGLLNVSSAQVAQPESSTNGLNVTTTLINDLMNEARTNNPGQLAADSRSKAAAANVGSIRVWEDPMFRFGGSVFGSRGMNPAQWGDLSYGLEQKLPLWGMPRLNLHVASAEWSVSSAEAGYHLEQLRRDLTKALLAAALAEEVVTIDQQDLIWLRTTASAVEARFRAGQTDAGDALQIQNQVALRTDRLQTDRLELSHHQFVLNRLLNHKPDSAWPPLRLPPIAPPVPFSEELLALAFANEPQLKIADQEIQRAAAAANLARRKRLPEVRAGVDGWQYSGGGQFRMGTFSLSLSLPWGNAGKYRKDYERAKQTEVAAVQDRQDQTLTLHEEIHHLTIDLDAARRQALLYQNEISVRAQQALADKLAAWESGKVTFRDVLDAHRDALDAELMAARATAEQYQTLADLLLWTGLDSFESLARLANEPAGLPHAGQK